MPKHAGPSVRRRQLGAMLRTLREEAGKSRRAAADWLEIGEPTISKIELGKQAIKGPNVRLLCQLYDVDANNVDTLLRMAKEANQRGWWTAYRDTLPDWARQYVGLEGDAEVMWEYQSQFVPGLLQTPSYVEAITRASRPDITDGALQRVISLRQERQSQLDNQPPKIRAFLDEAVLRRTVGSSEIMREQLHTLDEASQQDHITLRVVPFGAGAHAAMASSFVLLQFPEEDAPAFAYLENDRGSVYQEDPGDVARYTFMVGQLGDIALSETDSRALIGDVAGSH